MDIICVTSVDSEDHPRLPLLVQSLESLKQNCKDPKRHTLTLAFDGPGVEFSTQSGTLIVNGSRPGASACRNIGASSIPKYRRQSHVMFIDDDVYMCPDWDLMMESVLGQLPHAVISGHAHPFNLPIGRYSVNGLEFESAAVLSTVNMLMPWEIWDEVGFFAEPGGPGGSEDVDWCKRATEKLIGLAVMRPQYVMHCGLKSSMGKEIVGFDMMVEQNRQLIERYGLQGKVQQI